MLPITTHMQYSYRIYTRHLFDAGVYGIESSVASAEGNLSQDIKAVMSVRVDLFTVDNGLAIDLQTVRLVEHANTE